MAAKKIKMLKPGTFKAMNGQKYSFTAEDLKASATAYNPSIYAAGLVKGHPEHDAPRFGELTSCEFSEDFLFGVPANVTPAFREEVNSGQFPYVSLSLYSKNHPDNPVPGVFYPRHLGFLGAMPPAVKDLGKVSLSEEPGEIINLCARVEFGDYNDRLVYRILRGFKTLLSDSVGSEKVESAVSEWDMEMLLENAVTPTEPADDTAVSSFAETKKETDMDAAALAAQKAELDQREDKLKQGEATLAGETAKRKRAEIASFVEQQVKEGRVLPAAKAQEIATISFLEGVAESDVIEFGEGDAKKSISLGEAYRQSMAQRPQVIEFGEMGNAVEPGKQQASKPVNLSKFV